MPLVYGQGLRGCGAGALALSWFPALFGASVPPLSWFVIDLSIQHPIIGGTLCSKFARIEGKKKYVK